LEHLVRRYQLGAIRVSAFIASDMATAEDIAQNAFLKAADKINQFDERRTFKPWFYKIVVNDSIRVSKRSSHFVSYDDVVVKQSLSFLTDPTPLPEAFVITEETKRTVWAALGTAPQVKLQPFHGHLRKPKELFGQRWESFR